MTGPRVFGFRDGGRDGFRDGPEADAAETALAATLAEGRAARRTRLIDALRILPFFGVILFLVPDLILSDGPGAAGATTPWLIYLFLAWFALIGLAFSLARGAAREAMLSGDPDRDPSAEPALRKRPRSRGRTR